ncbi:MAG: hypothetical protein ACRD0Y_05905 [Terriglobales bacterium]
MCGAEIDAALGKGDSQAIVDLLSKSSDLAPTIRLQVQIALAGPARGDPKRIANTATAIAGQSENDLESALRDLANAAHAITDWPGLGENNAIGVARMADADPTLAPALVQTLGQNFAAQPEPNDTWTAGALSLIEELAPRHTEALKMLCVEGAASAYAIAMSSGALESHEKVLAFLQPACEPQEVVAEIATRTQKNIEGWLNAIKNCLVVGPSWDWSPVQQQIDGRLDQPSPALAASLIEAALITRPLVPNAPFLPNARANWLFAHGNALSGSDFARWVAAILISNPNPNQHTNQPQINTGAERYGLAVTTDGAQPRLPTIADVIIAAGAETAVFAQRQVWPPVDRVLKAIADRTEDFPEPADLLAERTAWESILGQDAFDARVRKKAAEVATAAMSRAFDLTLAHAFLLLLDELPGSTELHTFLDTGLRNLTKEQWLSILTNGGDTLILASHSLRPTPQLLPSCALQNAFEAAANTAIQHPLNATTDDLAPLFAGLDTNSASFLRRKALEAASGATKSTTPLLAAYGNFLAGWPSPPDDILTTFLCSFLPNILDRKDPAEIDWASNFADANLDRLISIEPACLANAQERAKSLASSDQPVAAKDAAARLAQALGQPIPAPETPA